MIIGSVFNPLVGKFSGHAQQKPKKHERSRKIAHYQLVKVTLTNQNRANLTRRQHVLATP